MFRTRITVALTTAALTLTGVASASAEPRAAGDTASAVEKRHTKRHTLSAKRHTKRHTALAEKRHT